MWCDDGEVLVIGIGMGLWFVVGFVWFVYNNGLMLIDGEVYFVEELVLFGLCFDGYCVKVSGWMIYECVFDCLWYGCCYVLVMLM